MAMNVADMISKISACTNIILSCEFKKFSLEITDGRLKCHCHK